MAEHPNNNHNYYHNNNNSFSIKIFSSNKECLTIIRYSLVLIFTTLKKIYIYIYLYNFTDVILLFYRYSVIEKIRLEENFLYALISPIYIYIYICMHLVSNT